MTVVASVGEGDDQDARGGTLVRGVNYVRDSFDASKYEDNDVEVESTRRILFRFMLVKYNKSITKLYMIE
jgi:hypothetical protein